MGYTHSENQQYIHWGECCVNCWQLTSHCTTHAYAPAPPSRCDSDTALTTAYTSTPPPLNMLMLPQHPQKLPPTLPLPLLMPSSTCLILSAAYHPYAHAVPSRHASNTSLILNTAYHPYAPAVPSR
ncbi:hypothetical protein O181_018792 [Austropuccinia psidii MF-1]|uniref:Uncharacterized protein n=1 Tax=Austropuccinia psidii MF-1 TaxID=1389203 RepID=A0A9Q3C8I3_9BASI|nr:hypothetical protein [Austropuccinia psidii MF-1]